VGEYCIPIIQIPLEARLMLYEKEDPKAQIHLSGKFLDKSLWKRMRSKVGYDETWPLTRARIPSS
jgi:hypothetical protein